MRGRNVTVLLASCSVALLLFLDICAIVLNVKNSKRWIEKAIGRMLCIYSISDQLSANCMNGWMGILSRSHVIAAHHLHLHIPNTEEHTTMFQLIIHVTYAHQLTLAQIHARTQPETEIESERTAT